MNKISLFILGTLFLLCSCSLIDKEPSTSAPIKKDWNSFGYVESLKNSDANLKNSIESNLNSIDTNSSNIPEYIGNIRKDLLSWFSDDRYADFLKYSQRLETENNKLKSQDAKSRQEGIQSLYNSLKFIFGLGVIVIIAGVCLTFFINKKLGYTLVGIGIISLALAAGAIYYLQAIAIVSVIILIVGVLVSTGLLVYSLIKESKKAKVFEQATTENVELIEKIKEDLSPDLREKVFGKNMVPGLVDDIQDETTKKIVDNIRKEL